MSENGVAGTAPSAPSTPRALPSGEIKKLNPADFGKKAELTEKLKAILKDVPVLHERMVKAVTDFEEVTKRARAVVEELERVTGENRA